MDWFESITNKKILIAPSCYKFDFYQKNSNKRFEYVFYTSTNKKITYKLINSIKNKYITDEIRGKCI